MEREIEKPEVIIEKNISEKQEIKEKEVFAEKEIKAENPEEKKKEIEEALLEIKSENVSVNTSKYDQDDIVSKLIKTAIAEGPEAIREELGKINDPYIVDQVHDQLMKFLNK